VKSYGTEGREKLDPNAAYVPPQDVVHPYLLFRGCDIKDLHVHETKEEGAPVETPSDPAILSTEVPPDLKAKQEEKAKSTQSKTKTSSSNGPSKDKSSPASNGNFSKQNGRQSSNNSQNRQSNGKVGYQRRPRKPEHRVGFGASLLNRKARGVVGSGEILRR